MKYVFFVCLVLSLGGPGSAAAWAADADTASIPVVRTWQDLLDQPAIPAGTGKARLGIEARSAPCGSGILLYCLTEGYSLPREWEERFRLGPYRVEIRHEEDARDRPRAVCKMAWDPPEIARSTALFRRSIPLDRPGKFRVRVFALDGKLVAETRVTATRQKCHAWMPLAPVRGQPLENEDKQYDAVARVRNRAKGIAIPRYEGMAPLLFRSDGPDVKVRRSATERLPALVPQRAGDGLTVEARGTNLVIQSKENIILARPDWHFLVRWWVNGTPFVPQQMDSFMDENGLVITGKKLLLHLDFAPQRIAARQGDQVEVQLLYCKNGWELVDSRLELLSAHLDQDGPDLLLSNRTRLAWEDGENRRQDDAADVDRSGS